jgi:N utilization substance protein B
MSIREKARELSVQALYQYAIRGPGDISAIKSFAWLEKDGSERVKEQAEEWVSAVLADIEAVDAQIDNHLSNWSSDRLGVLERAILRLAVYELSASTELAVEIIIDEAVKLAKRFCGDDSFKFVNGVLDAVATTLGRKV